MLHCEMLFPAFMGLCQVLCWRDRLQIQRQQSTRVPEWPRTGDLRPGRPRDLRISRSTIDTGWTKWGDQN
jgi:hypothetical protein